MKHLRTFVVALACGTALAACEQSPTSLDGGHGFGSGHLRSARNAGGVAGSGNSVAAPDNTISSTEATTQSTATSGTEVAASDSGAVERGGYTYGSGN
jgi:hypothetical protein